MFSIPQIFRSGLLNLIATSLLLMFPRRKMEQMVQFLMASDPFNIRIQNIVVTHSTSFLSIPCLNFFSFLQKFLLSLDESQDNAIGATNIDELTALVREWINTREINTDYISDVLSYFPEVYSALIEEILDNLVNQGLLARARKDSFTISKSQLPDCNWGANSNARCDKTIRSQQGS